MWWRAGTAFVLVLCLPITVPPAAGSTPAASSVATSRHPDRIDPLAAGQAAAPGTMNGDRTRSAGSRIRASPVSDGEFRTSGIRPRVPEPALQPWRQDTDAAYANVPVDAEGVRMHRIDGKLYEHPVGQAQYGLVSLETFRRRGTPALLARARAQADRLIRTRVVSRGAWFFPYRFDFALSRAGGLVMHAPWYSGMAQAEATSLFTHLASTPQVDAHGRAVYRAAAAATFRSLRLGPARGKPWVTMVDRGGYLWLQEYPGAPPGRSDFTFNGHLFALLGLWDYFHLTRDPTARRLFDGAATTALHYAAAVRRAGAASSYCVAHDAPTSKYHGIHVALLGQLQWLTGRAAFAARSDAFALDFPNPEIVGLVRFAAGRHAAFRFGRAGRILARRGISFNRGSVAPADRRVRIRGRDVFYHLTAGPLAGWFVRERPGRAVLSGIHQQHRYDPARTAALTPGSYVAATVEGAGAILLRRVRFERRTTISYDRYAIVEGVPRVRVSAGPLRGRWLSAAARQSTR